MHCSKCECSYEMWTTCPICQIPLAEEAPPDPEPETESMSYEKLIDRVRAAGGRLAIELAASDVGVRRSRGFPYRGYGFAWVEAMQGNLDSQPVRVRTTGVGIRKRYSFPYFGYGYGWSKGMQGSVAGHELTLAAGKVSTKKSVGYPWRGYGSAWTEEWSGSCGDRLGASLATTDVGTKRGWSFPYFGYGYGWARRAVLVLTLAD